MRHVIVTRFSVPRLSEAATAGSHCETRWIDGRLELFSRYYIPSVRRLNVPTILLCSTESINSVSSKLRDQRWLSFEVQNEWYGGWTGDAEDVVTRHDSDDALHEGWFAAVESMPDEAEVCVTRRFLRLDPANGKLAAYKRREPSPLAAFRGGRNPFEHEDLESNYRIWDCPDPYLLQVFHGGNVANRRPKWYRRRLPLDLLEPFGVAYDAAV